MSNSILNISNLNVSIKDDVILKNVNIDVCEGDFIFLKGENGSGKTTLLNVLSKAIVKKEYKISGNMLYLNEPIHDLQKYRQNIFYITQVTNDYGANIWQKFYNAINLLDNYNIGKKDVENFLADNNIDRIFPQFSLKKILAKKYSKLSEGQKKIIDIFVGVMRAKKMKILFIDEPLNHLDSTNIEMVVNIISKLRNEFPKLAIILTTHTPAFPKPTQCLEIKDKSVVNITIPK